MYFFAVFVLLGTGLKTANGVTRNVICKESTMRIEVEKSSIPSRIVKDHLRLSDSGDTACDLHSNKTHIYADVPLSACGTEVKEDDNNLVFTNEITTFEKKTNELITRKDLMELQFQCTYPKRGKVTQNFKAPRKKLTVIEKGLGKFTYQFEFYLDSLFQNRIDPSTYPVECTLGSRIFMQIEATSSLNNTVLFVETCTAAPYDNPNFRPTYPIIEDGCKAEPTVRRHPESASKTQFRFSVEAFKFIGLHDQVYISCAVMICDAGDSNTRCARGCINPARQSRQVGKREAVIQTSRHRISQGPLRLKRSAELTGSPGMTLNLNLVFVAGCFLAAVAMVSAVVVYKAKMSSDKYQRLPVFES